MLIWHRLLAIIQRIHPEISRGSENLLAWEIWFCLGRCHSITWMVYAEQETGNVTRNLLNLATHRPDSSRFRIINLYKSLKINIYKPGTPWSLKNKYPQNFGSTYAPLFKIRPLAKRRVFAQFYAPFKKSSFICNFWSFSFFLSKSSNWGIGWSKSYLDVPLSACQIRVGNLRLGQNLYAQQDAWKQLQAWGMMGNDGRVVAALLRCGFW